MVYVWVIGGLILGVIIGIMTPFDIPVVYAKYTSVALLAALDSVFGGTRAAIERTFGLSVFITGFYLYYVALISFGLRLFQNTAAIRRLLLTKRLHT